MDKTQKTAVNSENLGGGMGGRQAFCTDARYDTRGPRIHLLWGTRREVRIKLPSKPSPRSPGTHIVGPWVTDRV